CRPEPQWLAELLKQFAVSPIIGVVAGKVVPDWEETPPTWLDMNSAGLVLACLDYAASVCELPPDSVRGAGFAFRREVLPAGEAFRTDLGLKGGALLGSDEAEFCQRVFRQGFRVVYTPFAVVHHHIPKDRVSRSYFIQRWYGQGRSNYRVELMTASEPKRSLAAQVYDTLLSVVWFYREKRRSRLLRSKAVRSEEADIFSISCNQERQTGYMHENMHHQLYAALLRIRSRFPRAHGSVEATQE
ncbi:MAG: hypothetical protein NTZ05_11200, partial [Chloroflexi bacterium]|nr:hypothetical protein [Chloroflexota bacterium]